MKQGTVPVNQYYYTEEEWTRLGCGQLPEERKKFLDQCARGNPIIDGKVVKGSN